MCCLILFTGIGLSCRLGFLGVPGVEGLLDGLLDGVTRCTEGDGRGEALTTSTFSGESFLKGGEVSYTNMKYIIFIRIRTKTDITFSFMNLILFYMFIIPMYLRCSGRPDF